MKTNLDIQHELLPSQKIPQIRVSNLFEVQFYFQQIWQLIQLWRRVRDLSMKESERYWRVRVVQLILRQTTTPTSVQECIVEAVAFSSIVFVRWLDSSLTIAHTHTHQRWPGPRFLSFNNDTLLLFLLKFLGVISFIEYCETSSNFLSVRQEREEDECCDRLKSGQLPKLVGFWS